MVGVDKGDKKKGVFAERLTPDELERRLQACRRAIVVLSSGLPLSGNEVWEGKNDGRLWRYHFLTALFDQGFIEKHGNKSKSRRYRLVQVPKLSEQALSELIRDPRRREEGQEIEERPLKKQEWRVPEIQQRVKDEPDRPADRPAKVREAFEVLGLGEWAKGDDLFPRKIPKSRRLSWQPELLALMIRHGFLEISGGLGWSRRYRATESLPPIEEFLQDPEVRRTLSLEPLADPRQLSFSHDSPPTEPYEEEKNTGLETVMSKMLAVLEGFSERLEKSESESEKRHEKSESESEKRAEELQKRVEAAVEGAVRAEAEARGSRAEIKDLETGIRGCRVEVGKLGREAFGEGEIHKELTKIRGAVQELSSTVKAVVGVQKDLAKAYAEEGKLISKLFGVNLKMLEELTGESVLNGGMSKRTGIPAKGFTMLMGGSEKSEPEKGEKR